MTLTEAIDYYHQLLSPDVAAASWSVLSDEMRARRLYFGERPLSTVLRPRLITRAQYDLMRNAVGAVAAAARKIAAAATEPGEFGAAVRAKLMLTPHEQALIDMHPGYIEPSAHSRMDTFLTVDGTSLQFVEYNAESPAAIAYEDLLSQAFLAMPVMQTFAEKYPLAALPARHRLLATLLDCWREAGSPGADPSIAILDWYGLPTASEFVMFQAYFAEHGIPAVICSPDELAFRDGKLYVEQNGVSTPVTIVFKRVLTSELLVHYGENSLKHPLMQAYAAAACVVVNSFRAKLLHKKSIFALLSDEQFQSTLDPAEHAAVAAHVPWTRVVERGTSTYQGQRIDLLEFARTNREKLLLKPNDDYGGKGITIGWEVDGDQWDAALHAALLSPFVIQERVTIAYEPYPSLVDGQVVIGQRLVDSDPFLFGTDVAGCLCRLSTVTLLNVTAGGGSTAPVFLVDA
ncbi:MAG: circularly permuted type 2 ATP-grasp protein [Oscillochloris sp.]|nr:circularly permuted type 2 ATP-grasp protein [Oscillochloris sp.]